MPAFDQFDLRIPPEDRAARPSRGKRRRGYRGRACAATRARSERDPQLVDGRYPKRFSNFQEFIDIYLAVSAQIREPDDLQVIAEAFAQAQAKQNIVYTETTFTAITHVRHGMDPSEMWGAVREGLEAGGGNVSLLVASAAFASSDERSRLEEAS